MFVLPEIADLVPLDYTPVRSGGWDDRKIFYTYILINPFTHKPFYVGKGTGDRYKDHEREARQGTPGRNIYKCNTIKKIWKMGGAVEYAFMVRDVDELAATICEIQLIAHWGRKDIKTGILTNRTGGGEGRLMSYHSPETVELLRINHLGDNNACAILTEDDAREILQYVIDNPTVHRTIIEDMFSKRFGVTRKTIRNIKYGDRFPHIYAEFHTKQRGKGGSNNGNSKLTEDVVREILLSEWGSGVSKNKHATVLAAKYALSKNTVINVLDGLAWRYVYDEVKNG